MIKQQWEKVTHKVDAMSLRERALIFFAVAFLLVSLVNTLLLDPMLAKQKKQFNQVVQQQEKMKEIQAQINFVLDSKNSQDKLPQRQQLNLLKQELEEGNLYLKSNREKLVPPEEMADLLRSVLGRNTNLQLLDLHTLPVTSLFDREVEEPVAAPGATLVAVMESQIYKHGVEITVRGNYMDLMQYLASLERLPTQMFWGKIKMNVTEYPSAELTLTLYTLSLDKIWLQV